MKIAKGILHHFDNIFAYMTKSIVELTLSAESHETLHRKLNKNPCLSYIMQQGPNQPVSRSHFHSRVTFHLK